MPAQYLDAEVYRQRHDKLSNEYGFTKFELKFVRQRKPKLFYYDDDGKVGFGALEKLFIDELGYDKELLKTLVIKFPPILSKDTGHINNVLSIIEAEGFTKQEAVRLVFECPKLLSGDLATSIKNIQTSFHVYHRITPAQVNDMFKSFPYLYCCNFAKVN